MPQQLPFMPILVMCLIATFISHTQGGEPVNAVSPVRIDNNRFVLKATGEPFMPRGFNYIRLDLEGKGGHATFSPFVYDRERVGTALKHMAEGGFNVVRVFINGFRGKRGTLLETADATSLSAAYLDNLADFLLQARRRGILVIPCFETFPEAGPYRRFLEEKVENIEGWSRHYLHPGYIAAKKAYLTDVIRELRRRDPATLGAIFCWDIMNEVCYPLGNPPFSLTEGKVTPANGVTYDLATDRERLADEMAVSWVDRMAEAIRAEIPDALINANVFTYHAVGRSGPGDFHPEKAGWKNRYPFRPTALLRSTADVIDIHLYCPDAEGLKQDLASIEHEPLLQGVKKHPGKALLVGEFGAFKNRFSTVREASEWMSALARRLPGLGFGGWVHWTYDSDEQEQLWNAMSEGGVIFHALSSVATSGPHPSKLDTFNYILGTQTIGVKYQFTEKTRLVETAERILEMGSNILKIAMSKKYCGDQYSLPQRDDIRSLVDLAREEPSFKAVFDMPFAYYHIWAYRFGPGWWADGLSAEERESEYREIYDLAHYLLERYQGSGKTFLIGHWEGDWHLHPGYDRKKDPAPEAIQGMIDWLNVRQKAVDDAKRDVQAEGVRMYHYTEANLVQKALEGGTCLTNDVLPHTQVDYVSYSSYDTAIPHKGNVRDALLKALGHIESKLPPKAGIEGKRVFIGEYGFPAEKKTTPELQDAYSRDVCRAAIEWGCPFVLYWELYCNEVKDGKHRGFWLIDDKDRKQPFYFTLQDYYSRMDAFRAEFQRMRGRLPTAEEARAQALAILAQPTRNRNEP